LPVSGDIGAGGCVEAVHDQIGGTLEFGDMVTLQRGVFEMLKVAESSPIGGVKKESYSFLWSLMAFCGFWTLHVGTD